MDLSGIIFVVLAVAWAGYLVPKALKHHDEVARTRSVDRFSSAMRVLARHEPEGHRPAPVVAPRPAPAQANRLAAARAAARRRRRVTLVLVCADAVVAVLAALAVAPWWSVAVPVALTLGYLALCRRQVRREYDAQWGPEAVEDTTGSVEETGRVAPRRAIRVEASYGTVQARRETGPAARTEDHSPDEDTVQIPMTELQTVAVSVETVDGGSVWDPLPVTLPTYVNKARAARTVRTIDLGSPDTWTSGRDEADTALVEQAAAAESAEAGAADGEGAAEHRRAVGS